MFHYLSYSMSQTRSLYIQMDAFKSSCCSKQSPPEPTKAVSLTLGCSEWSGFPPYPPHTRRSSPALIKHSACQTQEHRIRHTRASQPGSTGTRLQLTSLVHGTNPHGYLHFGHVETSLGSDSDLWTPLARQ